MISPFFEKFPYQIILGSGSPRRQQFLKELGIPFTIRLKSVEEIFPHDLKDKEIPIFLSKLKATAFENLSDDELLITSDTIVWFENEALGKANSAEEASQMLRRLSGKTHEVITAICFTTKHNQTIVHDVTKVTFETFDDREIDFYINHFKPLDKAGAYGIQDWIGLIGVKRLEGSYFNVMGLPTNVLYQTLLKLAKQK
ncbi:MAG: septum formation protein Maf [Bacteroidetes bacterium HGW-Bacteroidetes-13]|nr:MAG: septum formation protein Maf [Bacteroidetes bacterium HGW-Bacteroidetes-13]